MVLATSCDEVAGHGEKCVERGAYQVPLRAAADGYGPGCGLAIPEDEHERDLLELCVADLVADLLVAEVGLCTKLGGAQHAHDLLRAAEGAVGDREDADLDRREPE